MSDFDFSSENWASLRRAVQKAEKQQDKPTEVKSKDGVTVKFKLANPNYVSADYKGWTIRVWPNNDTRQWEVNYFKGEDTRYLAVSWGDYRDENAVIKAVKSVIRDED